MTHKHIIHLMVLISFNHLDGMRSKPSNAQSSLLAQAIAQEQCEKDAAYAQMLQLELDQQENSIYPSCSISSNSPGYILINPSPEPVLVRSRSSKSTYRPSSRAVDSVITDYVDNKKQKQPIKIASISSSSIPAASASSSSPTSAQISISQLPYANILNELNTIELEFEEDNSNIRFDRLSQQLSRLGNIQKTLAPHYQNMPPMMIPAEYKEVYAKRIELTNLIWDMIDRHDGSSDANPAPTMQVQSSVAKPKYEITYEQDIDRAIKLSLKQ